MKEEKYNVSAGDYIKKYGETQFREAESVVVAETSARTGCVIATGGGAVLRAETLRPSYTDLDSLRKDGNLL